MYARANLLVETVRDVTVVTFQQTALLDMTEVERINQVLTDMVDNQNRTRLVLDFHNVTSLASSMLGVLLTIKSKLDAVGGRMVLCALDRDIRRLFDMTSIDKLFEFTPTAEEALARFGVSAKQ